MNVKPRTQRLAVAASPRQTILLAHRTARMFSCGAARFRCCAVTWLDVFLEQIPPRPQLSCVQLQEDGLHVSLVELASSQVSTLWESARNEIVGLAVASVPKRQSWKLSNTIWALAVPM